MVNECEAKMLQFGIILSFLSILQDSLLDIVVHIKVKPRM